jgi:hypothetical protein
MSPFSKLMHMDSSRAGRQRPSNSTVLKPSELKTIEERGSFFVFGWQKRKSGQDFWTYSESQVIYNKQGALAGYRKFVVETPRSISQVS